MQTVLEAISDPTRRQILNLLKSGEKSAGELGAKFDISGPSISHHLRKLKSADLVTTLRRGQNIYYTINTSVFDDAVHYVIGFFQNQNKLK